MTQRRQQSNFSGCPQLSAGRLVMPNSALGSLKERPMVKGLLLANPHWPWEGERRFHEVHLTIPGDIDCCWRRSVAGLPNGAFTGFNDSIAWDRARAQRQISLSSIPSTS